MAIRGPRRERDGSIVYNSHVPLKQPVAQAKRKHRFRFILTEIDKPFFILVMVLLVFGLLMMFSASYAWGLSEYNDGYYYLVSQLKSAGLGLLLMFATSYLDYHFFQNTKIAYIAFIATYLLTFYTALFGIDVAGAKRWIQIGPISFQPSELLKVTFIIIFAYIMSVNYPKFKDWKFCIIPFTVIMGAVALVLIFQRHMSAVMLVGISFFAPVPTMIPHSSRAEASSSKACGKQPAKTIRHSGLAFFILWISCRHFESD